MSLSDEALPFENLHPDTNSEFVSRQTLPRVPVLRRVARSEDISDGQRKRSVSVSVSVRFFASVGRQSRVLPAAGASFSTVEDRSAEWRSG